MAESPAHKFGQIIGDEIEAAIRQPLQEIADEYGLYLDYKHARPARGGKKKVSWEDSYGNAHDLDYVLEDGGCEKTSGRPRAFIETAWRRYTKHSRNKAQEIQGAVLPLVETYRQYSPFKGAVLAGDFTDGALDQLRSHGFNLAYSPYDAIVRAFGNAGADVYSDESTSEVELWRKIRAFNGLRVARRRRIREGIRTLCADQFDPFFSALRRCLDRRVRSVFVLALSGSSRAFDSIEEAVLFVSEHDESVSASGFVRYELNVRYSNGDEIRGAFCQKEGCIDFLRSLER